MKQGNENAAYNLGLIYQKQNKIQEAKDCFIFSAKKGHLNAKTLLSNYPYATYAQGERPGLVCWLNHLYWLGLLGLIATVIFIITMYNQMQQVTCAGAENSETGLCVFNHTDCCVCDKPGQTACTLPQPGNLGIAYLLIFGSPILICGSFFLVGLGCSKKKRKPMLKIIKIKTTKRKQTKTK